MLRSEKGTDAARPRDQRRPRPPEPQRDDDRRDPFNPLVIRRNQSKFVQADTDATHTLGSISCGAKPIVVGSYSAAVLQRDLSVFTSSGPTRDGKQKPEISAPGQNINAPASLSRNGVVDMSGTSMAAPHVTGAIALLMQASSQPLACDEIRDAVRGAARLSPQQQGAWHPRYGYGRIDALATVLSEVGPVPTAVLARSADRPALWRCAPTRAG